LNYAILINFCIKEIKFIKTIESFVPPKEIEFKPFFGKERTIDEYNVFFMWKDDKLQKFKGLYIITCHNINNEILTDIKNKIIRYNE